MSDNDKKLEEFFQIVNYISPSPNEYKIIMKDEKIKNIIIYNFHVVSSSHYIFIYINENLPIFKLNLQKNIKIKEYHTNIIEDVMEIIIIEYNINDQLIKFQKKSAQKNFFKTILNKIYLKYVYDNSILFYLNNLKKKAFNNLQLNYLNSIQIKISSNILHKKIAFLKIKEVLNNINKKKTNKQKEKVKIKKNKTLFFSKLFLNLMNKKIKQKKIILKQNFIARKNYNKNLKIQSLIGLKNNVNTMKKFKLYSDQYYIDHLKEICFNALKYFKNEKKKYNSIIKKYNKMNFWFIEFISEKLGYNEYLTQIYKERIKQIFGIIKANYLKNQIVSAKFNLLSKKILNKNLQKKFENIQKTQNYKKKIKLQYYHSFFMKVTNFVYVKKVLVNKKLLVKISKKQNIYQTFFTNLAKKLSEKLLKFQLNSKWNKRQGKYRLYEFFLNLFKFKQLDEVKINNKINVKNSFHIFSKSHLLKNKKNQIKRKQKKKWFKIFLNLLKLSKYNSLLNKKKYLVKIDKIQNQSKIFFQNTKKLSTNYKKKKYFKNKIFEKFFNNIKEQLIYKKYDEAADNTHNDQLKKKSINILKHYKNFKKEKKIRNLYFPYKLNQIIKNYEAKRFFKIYYCLKNSNILREQMKKRDINYAFKKLKKKSNGKKVLQLIKNKIKKDNLKKALIASLEKIKFNKLLELFNSKVKKSKINELLIKPILKKYEINNDLKNKIRIFNLSQIFINLINNLESNKNLEKSKNIFFFKNLKNKCLFDKIKKRNNINKTILFHKKILFLALRNLLEKKNKEKKLKHKYLGFIIKRYFVIPSKYSKLYKSYLPFKRKWKNFWFYYLIKQLKLLKCAYKIKNIIIKSNYLYYIKTLIRRNLKKKSNKKLIDIFRKKQNLKNFMISVLNEIKLNIYRKQLKQFLCHKFFVDFKKKKNIKNSEKNQKLKKIYTVLNKNKMKIIYKSFFTKINKNISKNILNKNIQNFKCEQNKNLIHEYFNILLYLIKHKKLNKIRLKHYVNKFLLKVKHKPKKLHNKMNMIIINQSFKIFIQNLYNIKEKREINIIKKKYIYQKYFLNFINNIISKKEYYKWKQENNKKREKNKNIIINRIKQIIFKEFKLQIQIKKKLNYKLKRKIFDFLKKNVEKEKDVNFYLGEARNFDN